MKLQTPDHLETVVLNKTSGICWSEIWITNVIVRDFLHKSGNLTPNVGWSGVRCLTVYLVLQHVHRKMILCSNSYPNNLGIITAKYCLNNYRADTGSFKQKTRLLLVTTIIITFIMMSFASSLRSNQDNDASLVISVPFFCQVSLEFNSWIMKDNNAPFLRMAEPRLCPLYHFIRLLRTGYEIICGI